MSEMQGRIYPKVLVISNNAFSKVTNNGKTLASFFKQFPPENIAQLYFNYEIPSEPHYENYFRITDKDMLNSIIQKGSFGQIIKPNSSHLDSITAVRTQTRLSRLKKSETLRIMRECLWRKKKWYTTELLEWLEDFSPEIVFLCAGDSGFAYAITNLIKERFKLKSAIYITDDYVLPRKTFNIMWWIRRNFILKKMRKTIQSSDLFLTISDEMRDAYNILFGVDSKIAINITNSMKLDLNSKINTERVEYVYTGGLHFKRFETLHQLAVALDQRNQVTTHPKAFLSIYSSVEPTDEVKALLNYKNVSRYCGSLNSESLKHILNESDVLVHVESFDKKCIESTRLSISTKIPEYLSLGKPILAIGPKEVASMKYLRDSAFCITEGESILEGINVLSKDTKLLEILSEKAIEKYEQQHNSQVVLERFTENIISIL